MPGLKTKRAYKLIKTLNGLVMTILRAMDIRYEQCKKITILTLNLKLIRSPFH